MHRINIVVFLLLISFKLCALEDTLRFTVFFEVDSIDISIEEYENLFSNIDTLDSSTINRIKIKGYCDDTGSADYNDSLSLKRAQNIEYLLKKEILNLYVIEGEGSVALNEKSTNVISEQRANNRKVEILIYRDIRNNRVIEIEDTTNLPNIIELENFTIGEKFELNNILFEPGKSRFLPQSYVDLNRLLLSLKQNENYQIKILGHIDYTQNNKYNLANKDSRDLETGKPLSLERAKAVLNFLIENGIDEGRLSYEGLGGLYPTKEGGISNRRVEIEIVKTN